MRYLGNLLAHAMTTAVVFIVLQWAFDLRRECRVYIKGFFLWLCRKWRGSGVLWTVHKFGDKYTGRIQFTEDATYRLLDSGGANWHVAATKQFHTKRGAEIAAIKLAKVTVCFQGSFADDYFPKIVKRLWGDRRLERDFVIGLHVIRLVSDEQWRPIVEFEDGKPAPDPESWGCL